MADIFISYSRTDKKFLKKFIHLIQDVYGHDIVWYDNDIRGGMNWWEEILRQIANCKVFIYLGSDKSLSSPYCHAELKEALRLHKPVLPVIVRNLKPAYPGKLPDDLALKYRNTQYVDLSQGFSKPENIAKLYASINFLMQQPASSSLSPTDPNPTPQPEYSGEDSGCLKLIKKPWLILAWIVGLFVVLLVLLLSPVLKNRSTFAGIKSLWNSLTEGQGAVISSIIGAIASIIVALIGLYGVFVFNQGQLNPTPTFINTPLVSEIVPSTESLAVTATSAKTETATDPPTTNPACPTEAPAAFLTFVARQTATAVALTPEAFHRFGTQQARTTPSAFLTFEARQTERYQITTTPGAILTFEARIATQDSAARILDDCSN